MATCFIGHLIDSKVTMSLQAYVPDGVYVMPCFAGTEFAESVDKVALFVVLCLVGAVRRNICKKEDLCHVKYHKRTGHFHLLYVEA